MKCAEPGLGVIDGEAGGQAVDEPRRGVTEAASKRDVALEGPASEDQRVRVLPGDSYEARGVLHAVLAVRVDGHDDRVFAEVFPDIGESGFERLPFAPVFEVGEDCGMAGCVLEDLMVV